MSTMELHHERRRYFRIPDRVALQARELQPNELADHLDAPANANQLLGLAQSFALQRERLMPLRRRIDKQIPELAEYLDMLESHIYELSGFVQQLVHEQSTTGPEAPTHDVDLSAQGIRFQSPEPFGLEAAVQLDLTLFPERISLVIIGTVVDCGMNDDGTWNVALDFEFIGDREREILVKHVHTVQLAELQRNKSTKRAGATA